MQLSCEAFVWTQIWIIYLADKKGELEKEKDKEGERMKSRGSRW